MYNIYHHNFIAIRDECDDYLVKIKIHGYTYDPFCHCYNVRLCFTISCSHTL